jgi:acyl-CoA synthetase (AMP-forming)/AMP-acid ligase II
MYRMLLDAGAEQRDLRSVRLWLSGADVMPEDLARRFKRIGALATLPFVGWSIGEATFVEGYGMVETAGGGSIKFSPPFMPFGLGESLGIPLPPYRFKVVDDDGKEVRVGEVGELLLKGPGALEGYHGDAAATAAVLTDDGWVRTGDLARRGVFGVFEFAGRKKDVIKHGGYSVFAAEVEEVLRTHPAVGDAAVVGRPDDRKGEVPVAFVQLAPGAQATGDELCAWARIQLSEYKAPVAVDIVDELPRTGTGKVSKPELRARLRD